MKKKVFIFGILLSAALTIFGQTDGYFKKSVAPNFRTVNGVFINPDKELVMVGGWPENDAIATAYRSDNLGENWYVILDKVEAMLNDCSFGTNAFGYAVGRNGIIYTTSNVGQTWSKVEISGNAGKRNFNAVYFLNDKIGFIVGGNERNDAIQTILKTTDGGKNWSVQKDNIAPWLRDVHAINDKTAFACGDGVLLKTTDGGSNWNDIVLPGNASSRRFNSVWFIDEKVGFLGGGHPTRDSIQTLLKTTDGGNNWSIIYDNPNPMINKIYFVGKNNGYVVGDYGLILKTEDGGETWEELETKVNDIGHIYDVYFLNKKIGLFGGNAGKVLVYNDTTKSDDPNATLSEIEIETPVQIKGINSARIKGRVHPHGDSTYVKFIYGEAELSSTAIYNNDPLTNDGWVEFNLDIGSLNPEIIYRGRLVSSNKAGSSKSELVSFYTGYSAIPNFSFEEWETKIDTVLENWAQFGVVSQVNSFNSTYAARLRCDDGENSPGAIVFGTVSDNGFSNGIKFPEKPDSLVFMCNYQLAQNDSATVIIGLKDQDGNFVSMRIHKFGGTSNGEFKRLTFPIEYNSEAQPDTLVLGVASNNAFADYFDRASFLIIDNVDFVGASTKVPNWDFEDWSTKELNYPIGWVSNEEYVGLGDPSIERVSDAQQGEFAIKVSNVFEGSESPQRFAYLSTGNDPYAWDKPSFAIKTRPELLFAHVQFYPDLDDTLFISSNIYSNGKVIGNAFISVAGEFDAYARNDARFNYFDTLANPDSASIQIYIRKGWYDELKPGKSYAIIDNISFDGVVLNNRRQSVLDIQKIAIYPNPFNEILMVDASNVQLKSIKIYNSTSQIIQMPIIENGSVIKINTATLLPGLYFLTYSDGNNQHTHKIIKK